MRELRATGVTIILTTHYIEEAEEMADRIGVINKGEIILVEDKAELMRKLGRKQLTLQLQSQLDADARRRSPRIGLALADDGSELIYTYDTQGERTGITALLEDLRSAGIAVQGPADDAELARGHLRRPGGRAAMNLHGRRARSTASRWRAPGAR